MTGSQFENGQLPVGWSRIPLRDVLLPTSTVDPRRVKQNEFFYVDIEAIDNARQKLVAPKRLLGAAAPSRARNAVQAGDVLFSLVRPYLRNLAVVPDGLDPAVASTAFFVCRPGPGMNSRYLLNFLRQVSFIDSVTTYGSSPPAARDEEFERLPIVIAPSREQERIADAVDELFSDLDTGVSTLERVREKLKLYRASVLKAAVDGTLTAEWRRSHPSTESAAELLRCVIAERRRRWEEEQTRKFKEKGQEPPKNWKARYKEPVEPDTSTLPSLPSGWCWVSWDQIGLAQNGRGFPSKDYQDTGVKLLRPGNLYADGTVAWNERNTRFLPQQYSDNAADLIVRGGELIMNLTAQSLKDEFLGRTCITSPDECCLLNQRLARLTPIVVQPRFMLCVFKSAWFRTFVAGLNTGSLIQHMFTSQLDDFVLPLPPFDEQSAIVDVVDDQVSVIDHLQAELGKRLQSRQSLRQSILRHAFSGMLVPQDSNDEPASRLLERIATEREARVRAGVAVKRSGRRRSRSEAGGAR